MTIHPAQKPTQSNYIHVALPLPPSVNHYYLTAKSGKRIMTQAAKDWMEAARWEIKAAAMKAGWRMTAGRKIIVSMLFFWPDNRKRDTHNLHKALLDAAEGIIYDNDRWALARDMDFKVDKGMPRVELRFEEVQS